MATASPKHAHLAVRYGTFLVAQLERLFEQLHIAKPLSELRQRRHIRTFPSEIGERFGERRIESQRCQRSEQLGVGAAG
jgi:hypothetical protein